VVSLVQPNVGLGLGFWKCTSQTHIGWNISTVLLEHMLVLELLCANINLS
jgi:hypothetical protein